MEHLLAALWATGVCNVDILCTTLGNGNNCEVPILDGSAVPFVRVLLPNVVRNDGVAVVPIVNIVSTLELRDEADRVTATISPSDKQGLNITVQVDTFDGQLPKSEKLTCSTDKLSEWCVEIAPARTFGFEGDIEELRKNGLGLGGSLRNCVVYHNGSSSVALRCKDEWARHKVRKE